MNSTSFICFILFHFISHDENLGGAEHLAMHLVISVITKAKKPKQTKKTVQWGHMATSSGDFGLIPPGASYSTAWRHCWPL